MSQREAIDRILADFRRELHTCFPAKVLAYDATAQTVNVQPAIQREAPTDQADEPFQTEDLPILYAVPVQWPRAKGGALTFPITAGDWVQIHCAEQSLLAWRESGGTDVTPGLSDPLGLNGAIAVPGWYPDGEKLTGVSTTDIELRAPTGGSVVLGGIAGAGFVALASKVDLELAKIAAAITSLGGTYSPGSGATPPGVPTVTGATKVKAV